MRFCSRVLIEVACVLTFLSIQDYKSMLDKMLLKTAVYIFALIFQNLELKSIIASNEK